MTATVAPANTPATPPVAGARSERAQARRETLGLLRLRRPSAQPS